MIFLEYIWVDKDGMPRSKMRSIEIKLKYTGTTEENYYLTLDEIPLWNFDGSSTGQNIGKDTEVVLRPVRLYRKTGKYKNEKIFNENVYYVLCELDLEYGENSKILKDGPVEGFNTRNWAARVAQKYVEDDPWFGLEQEYAILDPVTHLPYKWKEYGSEEQGDFYCSVKYPQCQMSQMVREHMFICADLGIKICGFNAEVLPSQWEFQVGPANLLKVADDLVMARYVMYRLSAYYGVEVSLHPKPMLGNWNGSGCHMNFSTKKMRTMDIGMDEINKVIAKLGTNHPKILQYYGKHNEMRLTGEHETSNMKTFSYGVGTRHTSVRIPNQVASMGYGYIEDRRAASNIDPYLAMGKLLETTQE